MSILIEQLSKRFGNQPVVDRVNLEVADGELFVLLGASGSGKSTVLRLIAGLTEPDSGRILLRGQDVTFLPPQERGIGFVFQNYSIFRHMSVSDNIEFGLKIRNVPAAERALKREQLLDLVGLAGLGSRYADQLSGGQRQRVALARALAYEPGVLLLDEPFGALDVKIRAQLRRSLKEIQRRLAVTMILVTHDQEEAFELADRIGVIERGRLLEVGEAESLYCRPRTLFVATFLGAGNVLVGRAKEGKGCFGSLSLPLPEESAYEEGARVQLLFRPEEVRLDESEPEQGAVLGRGTVIEQNFSGPLRRLRLRLPRLPATRQVAPPLPFGEEGFIVDAILPASRSLTIQELWVSLHDWQILDPAPPRLLVVAEGDSSAVVTVASGLAEQMRAAMTVLAVAGDAEAAEGVRGTLVQQLDEMGLQGEVRIRYGSPLEQLAIEQAETLYDMVVMGVPRGSTLPLLEQPDVPVLLVRGRPERFRRLLICTAAGEPGKSDVRVGGQLARLIGAQVTLLYIPRGGEASPLARNHLEHAVATLRALEVPVELQIRQAARAAEGILAEADAGEYDLIVMGGHGPAARSLFGLDDVTLQVLMNTERPVLVVPAEER